MSTPSKPVRITTCEYEDGAVRVELRAEFDTEAQQAEFIGLFPKSYRLSTNRLSTGTGSIPLVVGTYRFISSRTTGDKNEAAHARLRKVLAKLDTLGVTWVQEQGFWSNPQPKVEDVLRSFA